MLSSTKVNKIREYHEEHLFTTEGTGIEIPTRTKNALDHYAITGRLPGHFCQAVLKNDLQKAVGRADKENQKALVDIVKYVYNRLPINCWGSPEKVGDWSASGGLYGKNKEYWEEVFDQELEGVK